MRVAIKADFYSDAVVLGVCAEGRGFDLRPGQERRYFSSPVTIGAKRGVPNVTSEEKFLGPDPAGIESEPLGGNLTLYRVAVKAVFFSDAVECWMFVRRVTASIFSRVRTEDIFHRHMFLVQF